MDLATRAGIDPDQADSILKDPNAYLDAVRADEHEAVRLGARGVPLFVTDGRHILSGGQSAAVFTTALDTAWVDRLPAAPATDADLCDPGGACAVPGDAARIADRS